MKREVCIRLYNSEIFGKKKKATSKCEELRRIQASNPSNSMMHDETRVRKHFAAPIGVTYGNFSGN